jgi:hypothetical protein
MVLAQTTAALTSIERCLIALMRVVALVETQISFDESIVDISERIRVLSNILESLPP